MLEEGTFSDFYHKARKKVLKKKEEKKKKHQYPAGASGGDAGAEAKQKLKDKQHNKNVPCPFHSSSLNILIQYFFDILILFLLELYFLAFHLSMIYPSHHEL